MDSSRDSLGIYHIDFAKNPTVVGTGFGATSDLQFGPDGMLYVAQFASDRVLRISPSVAIPALDGSGWLVLALSLTVTGCGLRPRVAGLSEDA